jgi:hypothetical protein
MDGYRTAYFALGCIIIAHGGVFFIYWFLLFFCGEKERTKLDGICPSSGQFINPGPYYCNLIRNKAVVGMLFQYLLSLLGKWHGHMIC